MEMNRNPYITKGINGLHMEIGEHGYVRTDPDAWRRAGVCSPFSRLYLVTGGEGWLKAGETVCRLLPGYAYLVPAGLTFSYGCGEYMEKLYFHIHLIKPDGYDMAMGLSRIEKLSVEAGQLAGMVRRYHSHSWLDALSLKSDIYGVVSALLRQYPEKDEVLPVLSPLTQRAVRYVQEHLSVRITAAQVAKEMFVSQTVLARLFRREMGKTLRQYVEDMVFQAAQIRLTETDWPLTEISEQLGFCDAFYFSRRFRQRYGEPPSEYRKRLKTAGQALLPFAESQPDA